MDLEMDRSPRQKITGRPDMMDGLQIRLHPTFDILVREDGAVHIDSCGHKPGWTFGSHHDKRKYCVTSLATAGVHREYVHRLVAETFIPNPHNKPTVDHIDRNPSNNFASNLRWATSKEQIENSGTVLNRVDYGVRCCEDRQTYLRIKWKTVGKHKRREKYVRVSINGKRLWKHKDECIKVPCNNPGSEFMWKWLGPQEEQKGEA